MAKREKEGCPGCSRHCTAGNVHCKYGQRYFEKRQKEKAVQTGCEREADSGKRRRKWEKHVQQGGLVWKLLWVTGRSKRALRRKKLTEQELLAALGEAEQAQLNVLLEKISGLLE